MVLLCLALLAGGLAVDATRRKRSDLRGAARLGAVVTFVTLCATLAIGNVDRSESFFAALDAMEGAVARSLIWGLQYFVFYLGVEPFVRRTWPTTMIGWGRLLQGRWTDALVARDTLAGLVGGAGIACLFLAERILRSWGGAPVAPWVSPLFGVEPLAGLQQTIGCFLETALYAGSFAMGYLVPLVLAQLAFRRQDIAVVAYMACLVATDLSGNDVTLVTVAFSVLKTVLATAILLRFGALALGVAGCTMIVASHMPQCGDLTVWTATPAWFALSVLGAVGVFAGYRVGR